LFRDCVALEKPALPSTSMTIREILLNFTPIFNLCTDVSTPSDIDHRKAAKAIAKYGDRGLDTDDILLLIDNTILGSAKQGMFITDDQLFAYSEISGKYSILLSDIRTIKIEIRKPIGIKIPGITVNNGYFISLPGMAETIDYKAGKHSAILLLATFMVQVTGCDLVGE